MRENKKILAIVPARAGSKGLKNKNIKYLNNLPLFVHPLNALKKSKYVDKVVLSTDSEKIINLSKKFGNFVYFTRPKKISGDDASSFEVIKHTINFFKNKNEEFDYVICLEPTSPFTETKDIDFMIKKVVDNNFNSGVSISILEKNHPNFLFKINRNKTISSYQKKKKYNLRRQQVSKLYFLDGSLYFSEIKNFLKNKSFVSNKTFGLIMPKWKSLEIDNILDFELAKIIYKNIKKLKNA